MSCLSAAALCCDCGLAESAMNLHLLTLVITSSLGWRIGTGKKILSY